MAQIRILPPDLASQIAAGEVVERPANAAKELIENALDAGATRCDVTLVGGGIGELRVSDDGCGMSSEDARLCVQRHATSKLNHFADLAKLRSFGFRGEALPSIASVSRFMLRTRAHDSDEGSEVRIDGGAPAIVRPLGVPVGTTVQVSDLFYNVPGRRKFLRSTGTESGHVADVLECAALARPDVTFTLERDGRKVREWLRMKTREDRVRDALAGEELAACRGERGPLRVEAFLGRPERARSGAAGLKIFVNDRPVRDRAVSLTAAQAYGSVLERGRYPRGVLYLDLPPELIDINVHPQKAEVRFADPRALTDALYVCLSQALAAAFSLPKPARSPWANRTFSEPPAAGAPSGSSSRGEFVAAAATLLEFRDSEARPKAPGQTSLPLGFPAAEPLDSPHAVLSAAGEMRWSSLRFVAQLRATYLLCEADEGLYILDQHAAAERVTFTKLSEQYRTHSVATQALLFPVTLEVAESDVALAEEYADTMAGMGVTVASRGARALSVHTVPKLLRNADPERLVRDLLNEVSRSSGRAFSDAIDLALATMACHGSARAGDTLAASEVTALLQALDLADFAGHCPHGRPIVTFLSYAELERKVQRR